MRIGHCQLVSTPGDLEGNLAKESLLRHLTRVRADRVARAREKGAHFVRGNNVSLGSG